MHDNPREQMLLPAIETLVGQLMLVAQTGLSNVKLNLPCAETLAAAIASLFAENEYLKKIIDSRVAVDTTSAEAIKLAFGPQNQYCLHIPTPTVEERKAVATALLAAASKILLDSDNKAK